MSNIEKMLKEFGFALFTIILLVNPSDSFSQKSKSQKTSSKKMVGLPLTISNEKSIRILSKVEKKSIKLRWAPITFEMLREGLLHGYKLTKYEVLPNQQWNKINEYQIAPNTEEELKKLIPKYPKAEMILNMGKDAKKPNTVSPKDGIKKFVKNQQQREMTLGFYLLYCDINKDIAKASGLFFEDVNISNVNKLVFTIELLNTTKGFFYTPDTVFVNPSILSDSLIQPVISPKWSNKKLLLIWKENKQPYSAYNIERGTDSKNLLPLLNEPFVFAYDETITTKDSSFYSDSLTNNELTYYYRIQGIDPFGDASSYSNVIMGKGLEPIHADIQKLDFVQHQENGVTINPHCSYIVK
jgi:uncharacterized protein